MIKALSGYSPKGYIGGDIYEADCEMNNFNKLWDRYSFCWLEYWLESFQHLQNSWFSPKNPRLDNHLQVRDREPYMVNFARTGQYNTNSILLKKIPHMGDKNLSTDADSSTNAKKILSIFLSLPAAVAAAKGLLGQKKNGSNWIQLDPNGSKLVQIVQNWSKCIQIGPNGST